jgi:hypothetical protein
VYNANERQLIELVESLQAESCWEVGQWAPLG